MPSYVAGLISRVQKVVVGRRKVRPYFLNAFIRLAIVLKVFEVFNDLLRGACTLRIVDEFILCYRPGRIFQVPRKI